MHIRILPLVMPALMLATGLTVQTLVDHPRQTESAAQPIITVQETANQAAANQPTTQHAVRVAAGGVPNGISVNPALSADGQIVVFASRATNLMPSETLDPRFDHWQIYAYDRSQNRIERISVTPAGQPGNASSGGSPPAVSADGRFVAFTSRATNLVPGDTNNAADIFVRDRQTGQTSRVSVATGGAQANRDSYLPEISADGRFVSFVSQATNLTGGDTNNAPDVFMHDRQTGQTTRVSVASGGMQAGGSSGLSAPALSGDGRFVAFASSASNLVADDTNSAADVFVHDRQNGQTSRVSVATSGTQADGASTAPALSNDGRYVAFLSTAANLAGGGSNGQSHVYLHDRQSATTTRISTTHDGAAANRESYAPVISADGRFVAFASGADNLVPNDTNGTLDVFLHDGLSGQIERISVGTGDGQINGQSNGQSNGLAWRPALDGIGRFVAFESTATNLAVPQPSGVNTLFLRDRGPQATGAYTLTGRILGPNDTPVSDLAVVVGRRFPRQTVTDAGGRFTVANLPPGSYVVDITTTDYRLLPAFPHVVTIEETAAPQTPLEVQAWPCRAPSGLDVCALQDGDIVLELTPGGPDWPQVGGTYFTRAGLFLGWEGSRGPRLLYAAPTSISDEAGGTDAAWEFVARDPADAPIWSGSDTLDWAVVRPPVSTALAQRAVNFARSRLDTCGIQQTPCYGFFAVDGAAPIAPDDPQRFYDSSLIAQVYVQAGHAPVPDQRPGPAQLAGWITPDDLYLHNPQVQRQAYATGTQPFFVWVEGGAHVTLLGSNGERMGYHAADTASGPTTLAPAPYLYSGPNAQVESIAVAQLAVLDTRWQLEIIGRADNNVMGSSYVVGWREVTPAGAVTISGGTLRAGETRVIPLEELAPTTQTLFMPTIQRR